MNEHLSAVPQFTEKMLDYLHSRGISEETIAHFGLQQQGLFHEGAGIVIPIEGLERIYVPGGDPKIKWGEDQHGGVIPPFPSWEALEDADILCEGEFDCMLLWQHGYKAATGSAGVMGWRDEWVARCGVKKKPKTLLFDNDDPGRMGALGGYTKTNTRFIGLAERLTAVGVEVRVALWPQEKPVGYDVTDFFKDGGTKEQLDEILAAAKPYLPTADTATPELPLLDPPVSTETEQALIGLILMVGSSVVIDVAPILRPSDFRNDTFRLAYEAMLSLSERGEVITYQTVSTEAIHILDGRGQPGWSIAPVLVDALAKCLDVRPKAALAFATELRLLSSRRRLLLTVRNLSSIGYGAGGYKNEDELMTAAHAEFSKLLEARAGDINISTPETYAAEYSDILLKREERDPSFLGVRTGLPDLDEVARFVPGAFWIVAAAPGVGKTTVLRGFQLGIARATVPVPSLFASIEQPTLQLWDRAVAGEARVDSWRLGQGMLGETEWPRVWEGVGAQAKLPAYIYDDPAMTIASLRAALQLTINRYGVRVCFVDYIQLVTDMPEADDFTRVTYVSRQLALMARQLDICIVAASQLSRAYSHRAAGTLPELTDLRSTGQLEQDAFVVLTMARANDDDVALMGVKKNKNGPNGNVFKLRFESQYAQFVPYEEP